MKFYRSGKSIRAAFSLPEVAIAVGIAAVALISLMGIIPAGLDAVRGAGQITGVARMTAQVSSELQSSDWGDFNSGNGTWNKLEQRLAERWYFDDQANIISSTDADFAMRLTYVARARRNKDSVMVPGSPDSAKDLQSVSIEIAASTSANYDFSIPTKFSAQTVLLARQHSTGITKG